MHRDFFADGDHLRTLHLNPVKSAPLLHADPQRILSPLLAGTFFGVQAGSAAKEDQSKVLGCPFGFRVSGFRFGV